MWVGSVSRSPRNTAIFSGRILRSLRRCTSSWDPRDFSSGKQLRLCVSLLFHVCRRVSLHSVKSEEQTGNLSMYSIGELSFGYDFRLLLPNESRRGGEKKKRVFFFHRAFLGCIDAEFSDQGLILQHFQRSTRFSQNAREVSAFF